MITVMKFGGTSVGSPEALRRVAGIIAGTEGDRIVVASAMSGVTNFLVSLVENPSQDMDEAKEKFVNKHLSAASQLFEGEAMDAFMKEFEARMRVFERALLADRDDPFYRDGVLSQGERFSTLLLAHVLKGMGIDAKALTSEDAGVIAEGHPLNGSANLMKSEAGMTMNVRPLLSMGVLPVITGGWRRIFSPRSSPSPRARSLKRSGVSSMSP